MPNYDRTGPQGEGSLTGRQMGKCNPENKDTEPDDSTPGQGFQNRFRGGQEMGQGRGRGRGLGRGFGRGRGLGRGNA